MCQKDCGKKICQNSQLATSDSIEVTTLSIVKRYLKNPITQAVVFGGLEPFDSWVELVGLIQLFRHKSNDDIDLERTHLNYHLVEPDGKYRQKVLARLEEVGAKRRKDSEVMQDVLLTASPD